MCSSLSLARGSAALVFLVSLAPAQHRTTYLHPDGSTHHYEAVSVPTGVTWTAANAKAAAMGGYLATITSEAESQAVFALVDRPEFWHLDPSTARWSGPWIGGIQLQQHQEPAGGWSWTELEAFGFSKWAEGQPDDRDGANRIHLGGEVTGRAATWSDAHDSRVLRGFVVEFSGPSTPVTIGLKKDEVGSFGGYTLAAPFGTGTTVLLDDRGQVVHGWLSGYAPGLLAYLQPNGDLVRGAILGNPDFQIGGASGGIERFDWDGKLLWSYQHSSKTYCAHHDFEVLPNGNILILAWELKTGAEAVAAGRNPALIPHGRVLPDKLIEVQPNGSSGGTIVWEWHAWDHLVQDHDPTKANYGDVAKNPDRIDVNYVVNGGEDDWMHTNAVAYNPKLDQIMISVRSFDEVWVIDHSTTTAEARTGSGGRSGKGGRLLYRWGNPRAYRAGGPNDQKLFKQHDAHWIAEGLPGAGNILIFSNGTDRPGGNASSVDEVSPPATDAAGRYPMTNGVWGPATASWTYMAPRPTEFYSNFVSGAQRLANGNTMICGGWIGRIFEVTTQSEVVWEYQLPMQGGLPDVQGIAKQNAPYLFRSYRYAKEHPALAQRPLTPLGPLERYHSVLLADGSKLLRRAKPGQTVEFLLHSPADAGKVYLLGTSMSPGAIPIDARFLPLGFDEILGISWAGALPTVFDGYLGVFDAQGIARARFHVPPLPFLEGLDFASGYVVLDPAARSAVGTISNACYVRVTH